MLFHVIMTQSGNEGPAYNQDRSDEFVSASEKMDDLTKQFNIWAESNSSKACYTLRVTLYRSLKCNRR